MKTDKVPSYTYLDKVNISSIDKRKLKVRKEIYEQSLSSVMTNQGIADIPLDDSCNSGLKKASFNELPKKRLQKSFVKGSISLFLPADFLKDDRLVTVVKRINITPADF